MSKLKEQLLKILSTKYFWLNLAISIFVVGIIQLAIYFGCKYDLIPLKAARFFLTTIDKSDMVVIDLNQVTWRMPRVLEALLFYFIFFLLSSVGIKSKVTPKEENRSIKNMNKFIFIRISILLFFYCAFLANDKIGRTMMYSVLPRSFKDSFVVNCPQKTIQIGTMKYHKESFLCKEFCQGVEGKCVFLGIDKDDFVLLK